MWGWLGYVGVWVWGVCGCACWGRGGVAGGRGESGVDGGVAVGILTGFVCI